MAEDRKGIIIKEDGLGEVKVSEEVVTIIAGLAATEVEGVSSMAGNITNEIVARLGTKNLAKGIRMTYDEEKVDIFVAINIAYGFSIPTVCAAVQDKVKTAIENMTGLTVNAVNVRVAEVDMKTE